MTETSPANAASLQALDRHRAADASRRPESIDLPPEISALIDAAMARAASAAVARRPVVPIRRPVREVAAVARRPDRPARRTPIRAAEDMVLAGLFFALALVCLAGVLAPLKGARAAEGPATSCTLELGAAPGERGPRIKLCHRLPQHGEADRAPR